MGKTRDLFNKIGDIKGTFHVRMGHDKGEKWKDLTEAKEIKKRQQEYIENCTKKSLNDPDNQREGVTHLEPDIPEYEVKGALGSVTTNKASEGDGIAAELFQILKDDVVEVLQSICQYI